MTIKEINTYRDGGTQTVVTDEGTFYIDGRIGSGTKGQVYDTYPNNGNLVSQETSFKVLAAVHRFMVTEQYLNEFGHYTRK